MRRRLGCRGACRPGLLRAPVPFTVARAPAGEGVAWGVSKPWSSLRYCWPLPPTGEDGMLGLGNLRKMVAGVLHDALEDGGVTLERLRAFGFAEEVLEALDAVTRRPRESYGAYLRRGKANPLARRVKVAGLRDNLDESRIPEPEEVDLRGWEKYRRA